MSLTVCIFAGRTKHPARIPICWYFFTDSEQMKMICFLWVITLTTDTRALACRHQKNCPNILEGIAGSQYRLSWTQTLMMLKKQGYNLTNGSNAWRRTTEACHY